MVDIYSLVFQAYEMRNAGAVIHSHGIESCLVTMINPLAKEFRVSFYSWYPLVRILSANNYTQTQGPRVFIHCCLYLSFPFFYVHLPLHEKLDLSSLY